MEHMLARFSSVLLNQWQHATLTDYAHLVLAIVVVGWFVSKYFSRAA